MATPKLNPDALLASEVGAHKIGMRTDSAALLSWFLQNIWRLDPEDIADSICDGGGDKGVDALAVDDDLNEITILQSKHRENPAKSTQGDKDMKELVGAAGWFESSDSVDQLLASKPNKELTNLIHRLGARDKLVNGAHAVRLVFVTNAALDASGKDYADLQKGAEPPLEVWDRKMLTDVAERTRRADLLGGKLSMGTAGSVIELPLSKQAKMALCLVPASELVRLPGIHDLTVFGRNVRLFAGRTRINKELQSTVRDSSQHRLFPAFHNGLTLLTRKIWDDEAADSIGLDGVAVVNGCQSLVTLYEQAQSLTDDLKVLVKVVEIGDDEKVADLITYRSNNQNPVTMRDQRSSDAVMRDLKLGVEKTFGSKFALITRNGDAPSAAVTLDNGLAAQLITAAYLSEPWAAVRKVRLFDQDYRRIFTRRVTPWKLYLLQMMDRAVANERNRLGAELRGSYASVRFTLVHLLCEVLRESQAGVALLASPEDWLPEMEKEVQGALEEIATEVVESVNYHVETESETSDDFDPKTIFKSKTGILPLQKDVVRDARRQARRKDSYLFTITPADRS